MREFAEESSSLYVRPEMFQAETVSKAEWALPLPPFAESDLMSESCDSWATPTSKYQRSFGISPTDATTNKHKRGRVIRDISNDIDDSTQRFDLSAPIASHDTPLRKFRLSRSPLDNLQAEFRRYGNPDSPGKMERSRQGDLENEEDTALDALDWSFVQRTFERHEHPRVSDCPSMTTGSTISSRNSSTRSTKSGKCDANEHQDKGTCPIPECGRTIRDLPAHLLTHQAERPEKCLVETCEYHTKGFARPYDKVRHTLTHFNGFFFCDFCPGSAPEAQRTFLRCDVFLRHLVSVHGVEQVPTLRREELHRTGVIKQPRTPLGDQSVATCTLCSEPFDVQGFYEHLRGCVLRQVTRSCSTLDRYTEATASSPDESKASPRNDSVVTPVNEGPIVPLSVSGKLHDHATGDVGYPIASPHSHMKKNPQDLDIAGLTASSRCLSLTSSRGDDDAMKSSSEEETDWTDDIGSPDSTPDAEGLPPMLSPVKRHLVDSIMIEFHKIFDKMLRCHTTAGSGNAAGTGAYHGSSGSSTYSSSSFISRKRSLSGGSSPPPNDNGDDPHKRRRPDPKAAGGKQTMPELRFACPYYKRNPGRHQTFTSCRDPGFITVARLKEHLYRRHLLPIQCHRCCSTFTNEPKLREHQRDPRGCEVKEHVPLEGFDKDQERKLKSKKRSLVYLSEEDKWKGVYQILFPDDNEADMPSPYIEYQPCNNGQTSEPTNVARFQEFSRLELPRLVRRTLEVAVEEEAQPLEDKLKERLVDIVSECQSQLISMFQTTQSQTFDTSELAPALLASAGMASTMQDTRTSTCDGQVVDPSFQGFESFALCVTATEFIPIPATRCHPLGHDEGQKHEVSGSPDSGYDSAWTAGPPALPLRIQQQDPPPPFQPGASAFNQVYARQQQHNGAFMQQQAGFAETQYVDLEGYYGLFESQNQNQSHDVGFMAANGGVDQTWSYLGPAAGGANVMEPRL